MATGSLAPGPAVRPRGRARWSVVVLLVVALVASVGWQGVTRYRDSHPGTAMIRPHGQVAPVLSGTQRSEISGGDYSGGNAINDRVTSYFAEAGIALYDVGFATDFHGMVMTVNTHEFGRAKSLASRLGVKVQLDGADHMATFG